MITLALRLVDKLEHSVSLELLDKGGSLLNQLVVVHSPRNDHRETECGALVLG